MFISEKFNVIRLCVASAHEVSSEKTRKTFGFILANFLGQICESDLRQLHAHEHPGHEEAEEYADEADEEQQEAVEFGNVWRVGAVQDYKTQTSHCEEETRGQSFHNVLAVYPKREAN